MQRKMKECVFTSALRVSVSSSEKEQSLARGKKHKSSREFRPQCLKRIGAQWTSSLCPGKARFSRSAHVFASM